MSCPILGQVSQGIPQIRNLSTPVRRVLCFADALVILMKTSIISMVMDVDEEHQNVPTSCASCLYRSANPCCLGMTSPSPRKLAKSIVFLASSARRSLLRRRRRSAWWSETILRQSFKRSFASLPIDRTRTETVTFKC